MTLVNDRHPVIVVGAGPAGLVTSLLLSQYEVPHLLIEKYPGVAHTPRAHIINQRTVEIFRHLGLEEEFYRIAMPWEQMTNTVWHESLSGREIARRRSWGNDPDRRADYTRSSPCRMGNCGQHLLEPMLLAHAQRSTFADVRMNHEVVDLAQDERSVTLTVRDRASDETYAVEGDFVVGADGGRSVVAKSIGLSYNGEEDLGFSATIHFHADLSKFTSYRPGTLYWNASPESADFRGLGNLICHQPWWDWALAFSYNPETDDPRDRDAALDRLRRIVGDDSVSFDIQNISVWSTNHIVAREYSRGRVLCVGDAVHRHPPTNGLGLNTSVADGFNLAWKLSLVTKGLADPGLLDSYSAERQPVGQMVVDRAYASIGDMKPITEALGFGTAAARREGLGVLYAADAEGADRRRRLAEAVARTDYQFNAHGVEVGYRYRAGAIVPDGTPEPRPTLDPELYYHPSTWPGAHLPHAWIGRGREHVSTYDLTASGVFTLITGIGGEAWQEAAEKAAQAAGVHVRVVFIGTPEGYRDSYGDWAALREISDSGCLLVRPDLHIGWRAHEASDEALSALPSALAALLGHTSAEA